MQILKSCFYGKNKETIINLSSAELAQRSVNVLKNKAQIYEKL